MEQFDIPLFKKLYELYKKLHEFRNTMPKQDRYTIWQKCENVLFDILQQVLLASQTPKAEKLPIIEKASFDLNSFRILIRLSKEIKTINDKKYISLQSDVDEVGRMLGGWLKSVKEISNKQ